MPDLRQPPPTDSPLWQQARDEAMQQVATNAGPTFVADASAFVLVCLRSGPLSGEQLSDACKAAGIVPHNDKAFGVVYAGLSRRGLIVRHGFTSRTKGHGTSGGIVWRLA